jgi:hypothetical protein
MNAVANAFEQPYRLSLHASKPAFPTARRFSLSRRHCSPTKDWERGKDDCITLAAPF